jgi:hypothetical protein
MEWLVPGAQPFAAAPSVQHAQKTLPYRAFSHGLVLLWRFSDFE